MANIRRLVNYFSRPAEPTYLESIIGKLKKLKVIQTQSEAYPEFITNVVKCGSMVMLCVLIYYANDLIKMARRFYDGKKVRPLVQNEEENEEEFEEENEEENEEEFED
ncbi:uncharacterized protein DMAD_00227 [Drosophila madeirensis]|uniref:Uncharacterized protein n=1 Tax=Drosophila madeirensis TaxID=30013 RepID=A0AAU9FY09_DROMD